LPDISLAWIVSQLRKFIDFDLYVLLKRKKDQTSKDV